VKTRISWQKIQGVRSITAFLIATVFGVGLSPLAPGTFGTLAALPVAYFTQVWAWPFRVLFWVAILFTGIWSAKVFDEMMESHDNQCIVIDEVIGLGITSWTAGHQSLKTWIAAFVFFRIFDILKPPPIRHLDQWSRNPEAVRSQWGRWKQGFGVIADDMLAGFEALGLILLLQWVHILP
jgi:phosphatidylglycerophosphatase A